MDSEGGAAPSTSTLSHSFYPNVCGYLQPDLPRNLQSPRVRTAPPSPMSSRRPLEKNPGELVKQESLDKLRTTVQLAACSMDSSTRDIKVLGDKMAAATELMTETVQSLALLTQGVDRLQTLLNTSRTEINTVKPSLQPTTHQSRCSTSSSSSSLDTTSTFQTVHRLSVSSRGSPRAAMKTKTSPLQHERLEVSKCPLTNGVLDELNSGKEGPSNQRRRRKKKTRPR